ncbi:MAG: DUF4190 domain-containing protein [Clostridia bacterium]|nr:DUF4190 domain-containing protein [Clostridia bacterium]
MREKSGLATAGLVLGIVGLCTSFIPIVNNLSFILGLLAIIFGFIKIKRGKLAVVIISIILGVLTIIFTLAAQASLSKDIDEAFSGLDEMSGEKTDDILKDYADVKLGKFKIIKKEYLDETKLEVTVKNKSKEKKSFSIQIEAVDKKGNRLLDDTVYLDSLTPGQTQKVDAFTLVSSDDAKKIKNATFKIVEVSMY